MSAHPAGPRAFGAGPPASVSLDASQHYPPQRISRSGVDPFPDSDTELDRFRRFGLERFRAHLRLTR